MRLAIRIICVLALCLLLHEAAMACGRLEAQPQNLVYTDTSLDISFDIVLEEDVPGCIEDMCRLEFWLHSSIGLFSSPGMVLKSKNSCFSDFEVLPESIAGTQDSVLVTLNNIAGEVDCGGTVITLGCIMTIDDLLWALLGDPDECLPFDIKITGAEWSACSDGAITDIQEMADSQAFTEFCPKCDANNFAVSYDCISPDAYNIDFSFTGTGSSNYQLSLESGGVTIDAGTGGTFTLGPVTNTFFDRLVITDAEGDLCKIPLSNDCSQEFLAPTCTDGIQNQGETGIDCGGECAACNSCDLEVEVENVCESTESFSLNVMLSGTGSYTIDDGLETVFTDVGAGNYAFGPYPAGTTVTILSEDLGAGNCVLEQSAQFLDCDCSVNGIKALNDECSDAIVLDEGTNGPFNNYCATHPIGEEGNTASCLSDEITHSVWFAYTGNGEEVVITGGDCDGSLTLSDLVIVIYDSCESGTELACSDDAALLVPEVSFLAELGQTYYILVDGYGGIDPRSFFCITTCEGITVNSTVTDDICGYGEDGAIQLDVIGQGPFSFQWSNGATTEDLEGLEPGYYTVLISNAGGCTIQEVFRVEGTSTPLNYTVSEQAQGGQTITPFYYNNTQILVSGGAPPYVLSWDRLGYVRIDSYENTEYSIVYADNAEWWITITDGNGCEMSYANDGGVADSLIDISSFAIAPASDCTNGNGSINIAVEGGLPPYSYTWSHGPQTEDASGLLPGFYDVTVTDSSTPAISTTGSYWVSCSRVGRLKSSYLSIDVYPNPASGAAVRLEWESSLIGKHEIELLDVTGKSLSRHFLQVQEMGLQTIELPVGDLPNGIYFFNVLNEEGQTASGKLLIQ